MGEKDLNQYLEQSDETAEDNSGRQLWASIANELNAGRQAASSDPRMADAYAAADAARQAANSGNVMDQYQGMPDQQPTYEMHRYESTSSSGYVNLPDGSTVVRDPETNGQTVEYSLDQNGNQQTTYYLQDGSRIEERADGNTYSFGPDGVLNVVQQTAPPVWGLPPEGVHVPYSPGAPENEPPPAWGLPPEGVHVPYIPGQPGNWPYMSGEPGGTPGPARADNWPFLPGNPSETPSYPPVAGPPAWAVPEVPGSPPPWGLPPETSTPVAQYNADGSYSVSKPATYSSESEYIPLEELDK